METGHTSVTMVIQAKGPTTTVELPLGLNEKKVTSLKLVNYVVDSGSLPTPFFQLRLDRNFKTESLTSGGGLRCDTIILPSNACQFTRAVNVGLERLMPRVFTLDLFDDEGAPMSDEAGTFTFWFEVGVVNWW